MNFPALFDLLIGPWLDKQMLAKGVRVGSARRIAMGALVVRLFVLPAPTWEEVVAWGLAVLALDLQGAVSAAPKAALEAIGGAIGAAAGKVRSAYSWGRSTSYAESSGGEEPSPPVTPPAHT